MGEGGERKRKREREREETEYLGVSTSGMPLAQLALIQS